MTEEAAGQTDTDTSQEAQADGAADAGTVLGGEQPPETGDAEASTNQAAEGDAGQEEGASEAPESYEFAMPEGMELDQGLADAATPLLQKYKVSQEDAQALASALAESRQSGADAAAQAAQEAFSQQLESWNQELKEDQSFGGDNFDKNSGQVAEFIQKTVPAELKDDLLGMFLNTGVGNHPSLVKYIHHLSKTFPVGEDVPGDSTLNNSRAGDRESRLYPNMVQ